MMALRIVCFILMVAIQPHGWYTWVLGLAAVFLPYFAVVAANVSKNARKTTSESPELALTPTASPAASGAPSVILVTEPRALNDGRTPLKTDVPNPRGEDNT